MNYAIITGATGLIGRALAKHLISKNIEVLCIGKQELTDTEILSFFGKKINYISCLMQDIEKLSDLIKQKFIKIGSECCFFHLAWGTKSGLTSGTLKEQMENATLSAIAIKVAKKVGCKKFITSGSLEETFIEQFLSSDASSFESMQSNYGLSKIASRDMCRMTAYLEKIDYIHTRLSAPLSPQLSQKSYIASTLKKILNSESYDAPKNKKFFDIISIVDVSLAFELIGKNGKNKSNYLIGTGKPVTLSVFFRQFEQKLKKGVFEPLEASMTTETKQIFNVDNLYKDTGFKSQIDIYDTVYLGSVK
jgi:UDP-glucose 4-epimerase